MARREPAVLPGLCQNDPGRDLGRFVMRQAFVRMCGVLLLLSGCLATAQANGFERRDVTFPCHGLECAAWYYVPSGTKPGERRPAIVMANGFSAVRDSYMGGYAEKFAAAGFMVLFFDFRYLGGSAGEPRQQIFWYEQIEDYGDAITWVAGRPEVDPDRIGVWGTSFSGGHVLQLAAFDKRVKAVVSQVPFVGDATLPPDAIGRSAGTRPAPSEAVAYRPVVAANGQAVLPQRESYEWFTEMSRRTPGWVNRVTADSLGTIGDYVPSAYIHLISPTPLLMVLGSDDIVTPVEQSRQAFARAREPKKLVVVPARHYEAYSGPTHLQFFAPQLEWFEQHLMRK